MIKKILKYASFILIATTIILAIINLVNYYNYANVLAKLQSTKVDLLTKFELQESKDIYLYRTLRLLPWTAFVSIFSAIITGITLFLHIKPKKSFNKIR